MILIYESHDLIDATAPLIPRHLDALQNINEDIRRESYAAETVYVAQPNGQFQMVKNRNAPLDPFPVEIHFSEPLPEYEA